MPDVTVFGLKVRVSETVPELALMEFADAAETEAAGEQNGMQAKAAVYRLLKECIDPEDWPKFRRAAMKARADMDDLLEVITAAFEANTGHPTGRSSDSSPGPTATAPNSTDGSSLPVARRLEQEGRPGLAQFVVLRDRALQAV